MSRHTAGAASERQRRLIVNADDFGSSEAVNAAVVRAYTEGVLTSCSLMVTGEAFEHAVCLAHAHPGLAVGLHLVTVMGRAVLSPAEIPTLVDAAGYFSSNPTAAGCKYYFSPQARRVQVQTTRPEFLTPGAAGTAPRVSRTIPEIQYDWLTSVTP